jgi:hypothetical protein
LLLLVADGGSICPMFCVALSAIPRALVLSHLPDK